MCSAIPLAAGPVDGVGAGGDLAAAEVGESGTARESEQDELATARAGGRAYRADRVVYRRH